MKSETRFSSRLSRTQRVVSAPRPGGRSRRVATSNRRPVDLYRDGINRQLFLPFIDRLQRELDVIELKSARDYRLDRLTVAPVYYAPLGDEADAAMDAAFARLTAGATITPDTLDVQGRTLHVTKQAMGVARFSFEELCTKPLGAADYLTLNGCGGGGGTCKATGTTCSAGSECCSGTCTGKGKNKKCG